MVVIWLLVVIVSLIVEIATVDLVSVWFAAGGIVALVLQLLSVPTMLQIVSFVLVSIMMMVIIRPIAKKYLKTNIVSTNYDRVIGKHALVTKPIDADTKGEVKVLSTFWSASSIDNSPLSPGEYCEVLAVEGAHLVVGKIEKEN